MTPYLFTRRDQTLPYRECAGVVLVNEKGEILVGKMRDRLNIYKMPQGEIEWQETPAKAGMRELYEETRITSAEIVAEATQPHLIDFPAGGPSWDHHPGWRGEKSHWVMARVASDVEMHPDAEEFTSLHWVTPGKVLQWAHNGAVGGGDIITHQRKETYRKVLAEFGLIPKSDPKPRRQKQPRAQSRRRPQP